MVKAGGQHYLCALKPKILSGPFHSTTLPKRRKISEHIFPRNDSFFFHKTTSHQNYLFTTPIVKTRVAAVQDSEHIDDVITAKNIFLIKPLSPP